MSVAVPRRSQRAIGIQVIGGAADECRLVGVVTNLDAGRVSAPISEPLPNINPDRVVDAIERLIGKLKRDMDQDDGLLGIGIEIAGVLHRGIVVNAPALDWHNVPLVNRLSRVVDSEIVLVNDANALAIYERDFPDHYGVSDPDHFVVVLITELGIGLGSILNGQLYQGAKGMAGEFGHVVVDGDSEEECQCGKRGCLQITATIGGIEKRLEAEGFKGGYRAALVNPEDHVVRSVVGKAGATLGKGLSTIVNLLNPSTIVLYGQASLIGHPRRFHIGTHNSVAGVANHYMTALIENVSKHVFERASDECMFVIRTEENHRGAEAAAAFAIDSVRPGRSH